MCKGVDKYLEHVWQVLKANGGSGGALSAEYTTIWQ